MPFMAVTTAVSGPQQRREPVGRLVGLMRLQRAQHVVLLSKLRCIVAGREPRSLLASADAQPQSAPADGIQVLPARHHAHLVARQRQLDREIAPDRARPEHADLHRRRPKRRSAT
jgi:hypothetical protein